MKTQITSHPRPSAPQYSFTRDGKRVFVNQSGKILFEGDSFHWVGHFREGLAAASPDGFKKGFIDTRGRLVIAPQFDWVSDFSGGLAAASADNFRRGYIDKKGKFVIEPRFMLARPFNGDVAVATEEDNHWRLIDRGGKQIGTLRSIEVIGEEGVSEGMWPVAVEGIPDSNGYPTYVWGFADTKGNWAIKPQFSLVGLFREGLAPAAPAARGRAKMGLIDQTGRFVVAARFDYAGEFRRGLAPVVIGGKWGYVDRTGKTVIPLQHEEASSFHGEIARVMRAGKMSYIDTTGRVVWTAGAQNAGVVLSPAESSKGAASSAQDRPASRIPPKISQQSVAEILGEIDTAARRRNLDVLYARLGRNARIDVTLEGFGPT